MKRILSIMTIALMTNVAFAGDMGESKKAACKNHEGPRQVEQQLSSEAPKAEPKAEDKSISK